LRCPVHILNKVNALTVIVIILFQLLANLLEKMHYTLHIRCSHTAYDAMSVKIKLILLQAHSAEAKRFCCSLINRRVQ